MPARNTIFLSFALAYAESIGAEDIFIGVSQVDYSGYPDCRSEFIEAFEQMANLATKAGVEGTSQVPDPHSACRPEQGGDDHGAGSNSAWTTRSRGAAIWAGSAPAADAIAASCGCRVSPQAGAVDPLDPGTQYGREERLRLVPTTG